MHFQDGNNTSSDLLNLCEKKRSHEPPGAWSPLLKVKLYLPAVRLSGTVSWRENWVSVKVHGENVVKGHTHRQFGCQLTVGI